MSTTPITLRLTPQAADAWTESLAKAPSDGGACVLLKRAEVADLIHDAVAARQLLRLIDTPELVDFPRGVHMEAVHQVQRWGEDDRAGKNPYQWFWLLSNLATRALEHHKEAERLQGQFDAWMKTWPECAEAKGVDKLAAILRAGVALHREKAAHHCITSGAVLNHWHAHVVGKVTGMQPGHGASEVLAEEISRMHQAREVVE